MELWKDFKMKSTFVYMCLSKLTVTRMRRVVDIRAELQARDLLGHCTGSGGGSQQHRARRKDWGCRVSCSPASTPSLISYYQ